MGATDFTTHARGKTARAAFDIAVTEAQYEHGPGGYTGTIAEKQSFVEFTLPSGVTPNQFVRWIASYEFEGEQEIPEPYRALVARAANIWGDKWGPAIAIKASEGEWIFAGLASE